jgi:ABC-type uncharacterized transport system auxiliary subunit
MRVRSSLLLALGALACAGGPAPRDHFYRIEVEAPAPLAAPIFPGAVEVERFRADALSGGLPLVQRAAGSASELERFAYHQWTDPPTLLLQTRLCDYLRQSQAAPLVVVPELRAPYAFEVQGRIARLELVGAAGATQAVVELELSVVRERDRALLLHRVYREERAAAGSSVALAADAAGSAVGAIFARFLEDAAASVPPAAAARSGNR